MKTHWSVLAAAVVGLVVLGGCGSDDASLPRGYVNANGIRGGRLYDKFWAIQTGWNQFDQNVSTYKAYGDFFRCKQCHGWDLLGREGGYISRGPKTSRPNVAAGNLFARAGAMGPQQLFDKLKDGTGRRSVTADLSTYNPDTNPTVGDRMPNYGEIFTDEQIWDLVKFLKTAAIDVHWLYDAQTTGSYPTGTIAFSNLGKGGDPTRGNALYAEKCADCHGPRGTAFLVDGGEFTVGSHVRAKPYEDQHKIKFGQLDSPMVSQYTELQDMRDIFSALTNTTRYPDPE